jgi:hypothetical protein
MTDPTGKTDFLVEAEAEHPDTLQQRVIGAAAEGIAHWFGNPPGMSTVLRMAGDLGASYLGGYYPGRGGGSGDAEQDFESVGIAKSHIYRAGAPRVRQSRYGVDRGARVQHTEIIREVVSTGADQEIVFDMNPGLLGFLPWMSQLANSYEQWQLKHISFEWIPAVPTTTNGDVQLSTDFDPLDADSQTFIQAMNAPGAVSASPYSPFVHDPSEFLLRAISDRLFVREGLVNSALKRTSDAGKLRFLASGVDTPASSRIGFIVANYDIELFAPEYDDSIVDRDGSWTLIQLQSTGTAITAGVPASIIQIGAELAVNGLGIGLTPAFGNLTFPRGWYKVTNSVNLDGIITTVVSVTNRSLQDGVSLSTRLWALLGAPGTEGNPNSLTGTVPMEYIAGRLDTGVFFWTVTWTDLVYSDGVTGIKNYNPSLEFVGTITTLNISTSHPGFILIQPFE